jgi:hypothetical protein
MAKRIPINTLRRQLQALTEATRDTHISQIEALRLSSSHSIEVQTDDSSPLAFNCVMYAFGLERDARYILWSARTLWPPALPAQPVRAMRRQSAHDAAEWTRGNFARLSSPAPSALAQTARRPRV